MLSFARLSPRTVVYQRGVVFDDDGTPQEVAVFMSRLFNYGALDLLGPDPAYVSAAEQAQDFFLAELAGTDMVAVKAHLVEVFVFSGLCFGNCPYDCEGHAYETVVERVKQAVLAHLDPDAVFIDANQTPVELTQLSRPARCNA